MDRVLQRRDTASNWAKFNPVLSEGEIGIVIDGGKGYKIGDGVTHWNDLEYPSNPTSVVGTIGDSEVAVINQKGVSSLVGLDTYPVFSDTKPYVKGEIVNYGGLLYEFTADHEAGAWIGTDARETSLVENINGKIVEQALINDAQIIALTGVSGTYFPVKIHSGTTIRARMTDTNYPHNLTLRKEIGQTENELVLINSSDTANDSVQRTINEDYNYIVAYSENEGDRTISFEIEKCLTENILNNRAKAFCNYYDNLYLDWRDKRFEKIDLGGVSWHRGAVNEYSGSLDSNTSNLTSDMLAKDVNKGIFITTDAFNKGSRTRGFYVLFAAYNDDGTLFNKFSVSLSDANETGFHSVPCANFRISIYDPDGTADKSFDDYSLALYLCEGESLPTINFGLTSENMIDTIKESIKNITLFDESYEDLTLQYFGLTEDTSSSNENYLNRRYLTFGFVQRGENNLDDSVPTDISDAIIRSSLLIDKSEGIRTITLRLYGSSKSIGIMTVDLNRLGNVYLGPSIARTYRQASISELIRNPYSEKILDLQNGISTKFILDWNINSNNGSTANAFIPLRLKKGTIVSAKVECEDTCSGGFWTVAGQSQGLWSDNAGGTITLGFDTEYLSIFRTTTNSNKPVTVTLICSKQSDVPASEGYDYITIQKNSETSFYVKITSSTGKTFTHSFIREKYNLDVPYGDGLNKNMETTDVWYSNTTSYKGGKLIQGNLNFIYRIDESVEGYEDEQTFVGASHGCIIMNYCKFFADGKEFTIEDMEDPIVCHKFRMVQKATGYAASHSNTENQNISYPKLTSDGNLIPRTINTIDVIYTPDNKIVEHNRLIILNDGIKFDTCYGSMLCCYPPYFNNIIINNSENTWNSYVESTSHTGCDLTPEGGSTINLSTENAHRGYEAIQFGEDIIAKNTMLRNDDRKNMDSILYVWSQDSGDHRVKVYFQACNTKSQTVSGLEQDVFNAGDIIDVTNIREISSSL